VTLDFNRQDARDRSYATTAGGVQFLAWRDVGKTSVYLTAGASHLQADQRLAFFPQRRREWQVRAAVGGVFRKLAVANFAPLLRMSYERNRSTIGIYDYQRLGAEIGISRAF
jgi:hypothetical protein